MTPLALLLLPALSAPAAPATEAQTAAQSILAEARKAAQAVGEARKAHLDAGKPAAEFKPSLPEAEFQARLKAEQRPEVRQALLVSLYQFVLLRKQDPDAQLTAMLKGEVPSTAPAWGLDAGLLPRLLETRFEDAKEAEAFAALGREKHPDPAVRAGLWMAAFEANLGEDEAAAKRALERLEQEWPKDSNTQFARRMWEAQLKTPVGREVPAFSVTSLDDPKQTFTNETFKGKVVLIDFWASWCPPCRAELPGVHKAYARFKGKGFEILSLSWDLKPEDVAKFRQKAGMDMPWKHAYLGRKGHPLNDAFGVVGIPKPVLVGPDGKILATDSKLRGANLEKTLEKVLGK